MPSLKLLDGVHQSSVVSGPLRGNRGARRQVANQPRSAWTWEVELRPWVEKF